MAASSLASRSLFAHSSASLLSSYHCSKAAFPDSFIALPVQRAVGSCFCVSYVHPLLLVVKMNAFTSSLVFSFTSVLDWLDGTVLPIKSK